MSVMLTNRQDDGSKRLQGSATCNALLVGLLVGFGRLSAGVESWGYSLEPRRWNLWNPLEPWNPWNCERQF
jgi:hypothetical protein